MPAVVALGSTQFDVAPGAAATVSLRIQNTGGIVDEFVVDVVGPTREWATVDPPSVSLFPNAEGTAQVIFRPPRSPLTRPGPTPFGIRVRSRSDVTFSTVAEGRLIVGSFSEFEAAISPRTSRSTRSGRHRVTVTNRGNMPLQATVSASDPDELLTFGIESRRLDLAPNATATVRLAASAKATRLRGAKETLPFEVRVESESAPPSVLAAAFQQRPIIGTTAMVIAGVAVLGVLTLGGAAAGILPPIGPIGQAKTSPAPSIAETTPTPAAAATAVPTDAPTDAPTGAPTDAPTDAPTAAPTPTSEPTPSPPPEPERILYVVNQNGTNDIWWVLPDGTGATQLTLAPASDDAFPALSPDRARVAFLSNRGGRYAVWVMPVGGGDAKKLAETGMAESAPSWSAKGSRIVFTVGTDAGPRLCSIASDGSEKDPVCYSDSKGKPLLGDDPFWGADGLIYFSRQNDDGQSPGSGTSDIYRVALRNNRGNPQLIVSTEAVERKPVLSPDKLTLIYVAQDGPKQIRAKDPNAPMQDFQQLTIGAPTENDTPSFSPDNRRIVFWSARNNTQGLFTMSVNGESASDPSTAAVPLPGISPNAVEPNWH